MSYNDREQRICDECGKVMTEGYCIEDGMEHYCSDECLHKHYSQEEYLEMYNEGNGNSYWTKWGKEGDCVNTDITSPTID